MSADIPLRLPSLAIVLGFGTREQAGLDVARRIQAEELAAGRPARLLLNFSAMLAIIALLWSSVPQPALLAWLAVAAGVTWISLRQRGRDRVNVAEAPERVLRTVAIQSALFGLIWIVPPLLFSRWCDTEHLVALTILVSAMMAAAALQLSAAPTGALIFMALPGIGNVLMLHSLGSRLPSLAGLVATLLLGLSFVRHARVAMQRRGLETALAERDATISLLLREFDDGADWLWQIDASKALTGVTPSLARRFGRPLEALEGRPLLELLAGDDWGNGKVAGALRDLAERLRLRESFGDLVLPVPVGGEMRWWSLSATPRHDKAGHFVGFQGVGSDITEQRRSAEKIDRMARFDSLTGLANRRQIMETLSEALVDAHREGRRASFLIIDLDRFKQINDTLGHPVGDKLLKQVSERLLDLCGDYAQAGRLGGDEFAVVVRDANDTARIERLAEDIIAGLSAAYEIDGQRLFIGASIGSAATPRDGRASETLVRNADLALYRAKEDGRGVHRRYEQQLSARAEERRTIEIALRDALEKGEFRLVYQPIVSAATACIEGFEAYLRWSHPTLGDVPPERFLPIAEEARLISRIGEWVIRTACQEAASWPAPTRLTLNLASGQFHDPHLVATLVSALSASGMEPARLELEISETVFLRGGAPTQAAIERIQSSGVRIALSDFGMGYASLGYLRAARFSNIKLDRSFIVGASRNAADSLAMIRAVVAMADSLGIAVTAEGTETESEYELIRRLGCSQAQGYLFGHPVPAAEARVLAGAVTPRRAPGQTGEDMRKSAAS